MKMPEENLVEIEKITPQQVASICDHTFLLRPESYREKGVSAVKKWEEEFDKFLEETVNFPALPYAVCVRPENVFDARSFFENRGKDIKIASVAGFPHSFAYPTPFALNEAELAIQYRANEIDFVLDYEELKNKEIYYKSTLGCGLMRMREVCKTTLTKLILETSELTDDDIVEACKFAEEYKFDFVKTSSGFASGGATPKAVRLMRENFSRGVKISGGVSLENYKELLRAASGREDCYIALDPLKIRIGESSLLGKLFYEGKKSWRKLLKD